MDLDKTNENNIFASEILDNKKDASGDMTFKEINEVNENLFSGDFDEKKDDCEESISTRIKEESFDSCVGDQRGLRSQGQAVGCSNELIAQDGLVKEEFGEIWVKEEIKEEFMEDQTSVPDENEKKDTSTNENSGPNASTETGIQDSLEEKSEFPRSNVIGLGLSEFNSKAFLCDRRGKLKKKSQTLGKHFKCSLCPYQTVVRGSLQRHERTHTGEKPFKCHFCPYQAADRTNFQRHERTHTGEKPFKCSFCPYQASDWGNMLKHGRTHTGEKPFQCTLCPYQASVRESLQRHKRIHTGEKPFKCTFCPYQAADRGNLKRHERTHTGEKPFKCPFCPYQAADWGNLKRHQRTHTGEKPFKCRSCPFQAAQMENLQIHERTHTG